MGNKALVRKRARRRGRRRSCRGTCRCSSRCSSSAPAMVAGATMVLKPAPETPLDAHVLAEIAARGRPARRRASTSSRPAARWASTSSPTRASTRSRFTGSTAAGRKIAALCGERLRRVTLELGGKSAAIIMDDADLAPGRARPGAAPALMNNGQACVAQTRILASRDRYDEVVEAIAEAVGSLAGRRPARPRHRDRPARRRAPARPGRGLPRLGPGGGREGRRRRRPPGRASRRAGTSSRPSSPTSTNAMRIAQEEIFGPVLSVIPYDDIDDAVKIANDSDYGLSGSVYGADVDTGHRDRRPGPHRHDRRQRLHARVRLPRSAGSRARASAASSAPKASRPTWSCSPSRSRPADAVEGANRLAHPAGVRRRLRRDLGHRRGPHQRRVPHLHLPPQRGRDRVALAGAALPAAPAGPPVHAARACASTTRSTASTSASTRPTTSRRPTSRRGGPSGTPSPPTSSHSRP